SAAQGSAKSERAAKANDSFIIDATPSWALRRRSELCPITAWPLTVAGCSKRPNLQWHTDLRSWQYPRQFCTAPPPWHTWLQPPPTVGNAPFASHWIWHRSDTAQRFAKTRSSQALLRRELATLN